MIVSQPVAQSVRQAQHELTHALAAVAFKVSDQKICR